MTNFMDSSSIDRIVDAIKTDLMAEGGAKISPMRNYQFAIAVYSPDKEFKMRQKLRQMRDELQAAGWSVLFVSLFQLFLDRLKAMEPSYLEMMIAREKSLTARQSERGLNYLKEKLAPEIEGQEGLAQDVINKIEEFVRSNKLAPEKTLILLGRTGGLYPFFRSSGLLRYIDGKTGNLPVILLYPGERQDISSLSFMGEQPADRDYRPRIYS
ncbi:MAG: DUF1788 domain-containing protein [Pseudanabaena frigida]|uniref:DUF1788 domain-containing protein n=1 Tax=Pseudanabaena frigida TaxID=945775 RepID=A0A2W4YFT6_9CYAN|nr:MAG: DUF1788 domain-containing protein [Pseudanabaena frigida]